MNELRNIRDITLLGTGGQYYNWCNAFMGHSTRQEIAGLRADVFCQYVGGDGWDRFPPVGGDHRDQAGDV